MSIKLVENVPIFTVFMCMGITFGLGMQVGAKSERTKIIGSIIVIVCAIVNLALS